MPIRRLREAPVFAPKVDCDTIIDLAGLAISFKKSDGAQLLKYCFERSPLPVFVFLSSHPSVTPRRTTYPHTQDTHTDTHTRTPSQLSCCCYPAWLSATRSIARCHTKFGPLQQKTAQTLFDSPECAPHSRQKEHLPYNIQHRTNWWWCLGHLQVCFRTVSYLFECDPVFFFFFFWRVEL